MLKQGDIPFEGAQAHHTLPWKFREWFAERGLNVNSTEFGAWVRGGGDGGHQSWSKAYNDVWDNFITGNPNASYNEVLEFLDSIRHNDMWDGGF